MARVWNFDLQNKIFIKPFSREESIHNYDKKVFFKMTGNKGTNLDHYFDIQICLSMS